MLAPETVLQGRYRILRQLGQGGMGAVYEAIDQRLDTTVALKETLFADERLRKQFEREARLLARLHHPALPRVSDHFSEGDGQFLVMQFIPGDDLAEMMARKRGSFSIDQVLTWADQLLDALDYLHTQDPQIIHRDIKPQNLKLTSRGQIILLDFGLAKGQAGDISRITTAASIFGYTPNYAPLEQVQGLGTDSRSDIYALGATLYHLLTGVKPPDALSRAAALVNGQPDPLQAASEANAGVPAELDGLLQKAMAQNREQRYPSAAEMRKSLHATDQAATVTNRGEAKTVLFPPSAPTTGALTQAVVKQDTVSAGETTVVRRTVGLTGKKRIPGWLLSSAALVVVAAGVLSFYVIQNRNKGVAQDLTNATPTPTPIQSPTVATQSEATPQPSATVQEPKPQPTAAPARKTDRAARVEESRRDQKSQEPEPPPAGTGHAERPPVEPKVPDVNVETPKTPRPNSRPRTQVMPGGVIIRNFPDGSQILTTPDGTRIYTAPDGRREVFRPGEKVIRRRVPPKP